MQRKAFILTTLAVAALAGCAEKDPVLTGERLNVRDVLETRAVAADPVHVNESRAIALPPAVTNANWSQSPVTPSARVANAALSAAPQPLFSTSIGTGDTRRSRLNADPVVADGRVFTMDSKSVVRAVSASGDVLWSKDLTPAREKTPVGQGGGLAVGGGTLFVSSGYGSVVALDPATGGELWEQKLGNTATGAPSYADGLVYVVSGDTTGWAIEAGNGRVRWQIDGQGDINNVAGAPAPAVGDQHVVFAFGTGAVQGAFRQGGLRMWNSELLGRRQGVTVAGIDDVTGDPLIAGDVVYAGNHSGQVAAMSVYDGERLWSAPIGALGPLWPAGDSVFFVSDREQLVRLDAATGAEIWKVDLPGYKPKRRPNKRRDAAYANMGPVMAGGRLMVAGSDGYVRAFDPANGALVASLEVPGGATTRPVVADGTLYVVSKKGVLHAFR
ncbi:PQQ-like beta-propeller repeat protein [Sagittula salina]|uniref:PQQ-binding-like beta-propeller repeat protein n=1 Tax=Sagittula salina TaxID=2820268 RepID=A0A940MNG9_9RHOB|nr:PQQ-like beta-propeller repeat protein [Sagittula salina]MBP0481763.1 PQQ-binding-like beta-propeller repeat protein [Sagittula salina]